MQNCHDLLNRKHGAACSLRWHAYQRLYISAVAMQPQLALTHLLLTRHPLRVLNSELRFCQGARSLRLRSSGICCRCPGGRRRTVSRAGCSAGLGGGCIGV